MSQRPTPTNGEETCRAPMLNSFSGSKAPLDHTAPALSTRARFSLRYLLLLISLFALALLPGVYWNWGPWSPVFAIWLAGVLLAFLHRRTELGAILLIVGLLVLMSLPWKPRFAISSRINDAHRQNLRQLSAALLLYKEVHGQLPPPYTVDEQGKPLHSWRALILPYLDEKELYDSIDFTKPWDDPANRHAADRMPSVFNCLLSPKSQPPNTTACVAIVGPGTLWPPPEARAARSPNIPDGPEQTLLVIASPTFTTHWMAPNDPRFDSLTAAEQGEQTNRLNHRQKRYLHAAFADGHLQRFPPSLSAERLKGMATIDGGEEVDLDSP